ncbi:hypothetical protein [Duganella sp. Dugasp56]|uniref:hypothetical protein n=1 Tax=Duganella sp. Dugasp56 TaxID=3243046 RepID=UPI0039B084B9
MPPAAAGAPVRACLRRSAGFGNARNGCRTSAESARSTAGSANSPSAALPRGRPPPPGAPRPPPPPAPAPPRPRPPPPPPPPPTPRGFF